MSTLLFRLRMLLQSLSTRTGFVALLSLAAALLAIPLPDIEPIHDIAEVLADGALGSLLSTLSNTMLVIATFSLGTMASAFHAASSNTTPRAVPLLLAGSKAQNAVATFIGAFLFGMVARLGLLAGLYTPTAQVCLFGVAVAVITWVTTTLVGWVEEVTQLGRVGNTMERLRAEIVRSSDGPFGRPAFGGREGGGPRDGGRDILSERSGFVQNIDIEQLERTVGEEGGELRVLARVGDRVWPGIVLGRVWGISDDDADALSDAWFIGARRSFAADPRYSFVLLGEIASRALSPGINDSGTAIDALAMVAHAVHDLAALESSSRERAWLEVDPVGVEDLVRDVLDPLVRDAAGRVEVHRAWHRALRDLAAADPGSMEVLAQRARQGIERDAEGLRGHERQALAREVAGLWREEGAGSEG